MNFVDRFSKITQISNFTKIRRVWAVMFHTERRMERQTWRSSQSLFAIFTTFLVVTSCNAESGHVRDVSQCEEARDVLQCEEARDVSMWRSTLSVTMYTRMWCVTMGKSTLSVTMCTRTWCGTMWTRTDVAQCENTQPWTPQVWFRRNAVLRIKPPQVMMKTSKSPHLRPQDCRKAGSLDNVLR